MFFFPPLFLLSPQTSLGCSVALRSPQPGPVLGVSTRSLIRPSALVCPAFTIHSGSYLIFIIIFSLCRVVTMCSPTSAVGIQHFQLFKILLVQKTKHFDISPLIQIWSWINFSVTNSKAWNDSRLLTCVGRPVSSGDRERCGDGANADLQHQQRRLGAAVRPEGETSVTFILKGTYYWQPASSLFLKCVTKRQRGTNGENKEQTRRTVMWCGPQDFT